jgi:hypothetical protein
MFSHRSPADRLHPHAPGLRRGGPFPLHAILPDALDRLVLAGRCARDGVGDGADTEHPGVPTAAPGRFAEAA